MNLQSNFQAGENYCPCLESLNDEQADELLHCTLPINQGSVDINLYELWSHCKGNEFFISLFVLILKNETYIHKLNRTRKAKKLWYFEVEP